MTNEVSAALRRCLLVLGVFVVVVVPAAASSDGTRPQPPGIEQFQEVLADPAATDEPPPAPTPAELEASEDAYDNLSDTSALGVAREHLDDILHAQLVPELDLEPGEEVDKYVDDYTARITQETTDEPAPPSKPPLIVESTLPLRAPEAGAAKPVDGDLVESDGHFEAKNAVVEAEIPADLESGVELPAAEVTVAPATTAESDATPVSDTVFYANGAGTDSDYLLAPTATGAEIALLLRSPESPESFPLDIEMPAGASLQSTPDGGAQVTHEGEALIGISPPRAWDAADREIAVRYVIADDRITIEVPRDPADEILWPITVDPFVHQYQWGTQGSPYLDYWWWAASNTNDFNGFFDYDQGGVTNRAREARNFSDGAYGEWLVNSIGDSFIERVDFFNYDHSPTEPGGCTTLGIWMPDQFQWAPVTIENPANGSRTTGSYARYCQNQSHQTRRVWVGATDVYDGPGGDAEAYDHSMGVFALTSNAGYRANRMSNLLRAAHVYRYVRDDTPPVLNASGPLVNTSNPVVVADPEVNVSATDNRSGVAAILLEVDGTGIDALMQGCGFGVACGLSGILWGRTVDLSPGSHTYRITAWDHNGNSTSRTGNFTVDATLPGLSLSGTLVDSAGRPLPADVAGLNIQASDSGPLVSGVANLRVTVDGTLALNKNLACSPTCPSATSASYTYSKSEWGPGPHTVRVSVTDRAGNSEDRALIVDDPAGNKSAKCPTVTPAAGTGGTTLSVAQAKSAFRPQTAILPSESTYAADIESTIDPSLVRSSAPPAPLEATQTLNPDTVASQPSGEITIGDALCLVPTHTTATKTAAGIVNDDTALYANSAPDTDMVVRPTASGETVILSLRGPAAPASFSFAIGMRQGTTLRQLPSGRIALVDVSEPATPNIDVPPAPAGAADRREIPDATTQLADAMYEVSIAEQETMSVVDAGDSVVAVIPQPYIVDADGNSRPTTATLTWQENPPPTDCTPIHTCPRPPPTPIVTVASQPDARGIVMRIPEGVGRCAKTTGLIHRVLGHEEMLFVNTSTCILEGESGIFARSQLRAAPATHIAVRLRVHSALRGVHVANSRMLLNPNPDPTVDIQTWAARAKGFWCGRLWEKTRLGNTEIRWVPMKGTQACANLNPFKSPPSPGT
jgi:hypothetical protein